MIRGTAHDVDMVDMRTLPPFRSAAELVRWHFNDGRRLLDGQRAIDYGREATDRNPYALEGLRHQFAMTTRALSVLTDPRELRVIVSLFSDGMSGVHLADRMGMSTQTVSRIRRDALNRIAEYARAAGLIP